MGKSTEQVLKKTKCTRTYCEHGIDDITECTACLAKSNLLLETDYAKV